MAEGPDSIVIEHLRAIRDELGRVNDRLGRMEEKLDDTEQALKGNTLLLGMLAGHVQHIDERLEAVEKKVGH